MWHEIYKLMDMTSIVKTKLKRLALLGILALSLGGCVNFLDGLYGELHVLSISKTDETESQPASIEVKLKKTGRYGINIELIDLKLKDKNGDTMSHYQSPPFKENPNIKIERKYPYPMTCDNGGCRYEEYNVHITFTTNDISSHTEYSNDTYFIEWYSDGTRDSITF